jgi:hypothetical protein
VLAQRADGPAFNEPPALHFGSTVLAFATVFGMRRLLTHSELPRQISTRHIAHALSFVCF